MDPVLKRKLNKSNVTFNGVKIQAKKLKRKENLPQSSKNTSKRQKQGNSSLDLTCISRPKLIHIIGFQYARFLDKFFELRAKNEVTIEKLSLKKSLGGCGFGPVILQKLKDAGITFKGCLVKPVPKKRKRSRSSF